MGSIHEATCVCGLHRRVTVGGGMADYLVNDPFPFLCDKCGLVEANMAKQPIVCPTCGSGDIQQYGTPPISEMDDEAIPAIRNGSFTAPEKRNLCPACRKMSLIFHRAMVLFD